MNVKWQIKITLWLTTKDNLIITKSRSVEHCQYAFHLRREQVCINPYHYNKVTINWYPSLTFTIAKIMNSIKLTKNVSRWTPLPYLLCWCQSPATQYRSPTPMGASTLPMGRTWKNSDVSPTSTLTPQVSLSSSNWSNCILWSQATKRPRVTSCL